MRITETLTAEHRVFGAVYEFIERALPELSSLAEIQTLARLVEALLRDHADAEENQALVVLAHLRADRGQFDTMFEEHEEMASRLERVKTATNLAGARRELRSALAFSRAHFAGEERRVFPLLERELEPETQARLAHALLERRSQSAAELTPAA